MLIDEAVAEAVAMVPSIPARRVLLGLAGPPAAGKSTLARQLVEAVNARLGAEQAAYVPLDGFHLSNAELDRLGRRGRKGAPDTFDVDGYVHLLRRLRREVDRPVYVPDFDRRLEEPIAAALVVLPDARMVVTEGNYLADSADGWHEIRDLLDALWYVDASRTVREQRLLERHLGGGRSEAEALAFIGHSERPNAERVERARGVCSRVIEGRWAGGAGAES